MAIIFSALFTVILVEKFFHNEEEKVKAFFSVLKARSWTVITVLFLNNNGAIVSGQCTIVLNYTFLKPCYMHFQLICLFLLHFLEDA